MNYSLDTPIKRKVFVPDNDVPFAPAFSPPNTTETDQTHRAMTWQHDNKQKAIASNTGYPQSARLEKKK